MEAKEKAKELVYKFDDAMEFATPQRFAKQCALIAIDEIIKEHYPQDAERCQYWLDVKHEVSLL